MLETTDLKTTEPTTLEAMPELLSVKQAAQVLNVAPRTVNKMCSQGRIKAVKVMSVWRVNRDALLSFAGLTD